MTNFLNLQAEKLDLNAISELITHESCGAVSFFVGTTRDNFEDKQVLSLEYEAYDRMALKSMTQICDELRTKWPDIKNIAIYHRLGVVPVREASVIIGISSPHRQTSLDAVQLAIDRLKQIVPIWKKERYHAVRKPSGLAHRLKYRPKVDFSSCAVPVEIAEEVPPNLVQIHANEMELRRRVNCFVDQKRDEINQNNVQDFIEPIAARPLSDGGVVASEDADDGLTCARVQSSVYRSKNASSHLRIHRVKNEHGPQMRQPYTDALDKLMATTKSPGIDDDGAVKKIKIETYEGVRERLDDVEMAIGLRPTDGNIYARLKAIEQRITYLETASPEYSHFVSSGIVSSLDNSKKVKLQPKRTYTPADVDSFIKTLKQQKTDTGTAGQ